MNFTSNSNFGTTLYVEIVYSLALLELYEPRDLRKIGDWFCLGLILSCGQVGGFLHENAKCSVAAIS